VAVFAPDLKSLESLCRRLLLIADTVVFNVATYSEAPAISIFPIPDSTESPVLGVATVQMLTMTAALAESRGPDTVLGYEWGRESAGWQRSNFTRTSEPYRNDRRESCHIAVGLGSRYGNETYDWLSEQARDLMVRGSLVFAPFVRVTPEAASADEGLYRLLFSWRGSFQ
jgi:hypothetical protein